MPTRRDFLTTLGVAFGAASLGCARAFEAEDVTRSLPRIGIQLYTLRSLMEKDVEGTLARVAGIGYKEVEFAGYFGRMAAQIRGVLTANGLTSPSTHIAFPTSDDAWKRTLDEANTIGHKWVVIAWLDAAMHKNPEDWARIAERFNVLGARARENGLRFAYHNHDFEFARVGEGTALDTLLSKTDPRFVDLEMDLYWVVKGGGDPLDLIKRHPHRFPLMHAKDATAAPTRAMVDVGSGTIDFAKIFARQKDSGMAHVFVEHDEPTDAMQSATNSYRYLAGLKY
jgi:sugar phosphate isomerase/epimerase